MSLTFHVHFGERESVTALSLSSLSLSLFLERRGASTVDGALSHVSSWLIIRRDSAFFSPRPNFSRGVGMQGCVFSWASFSRHAFVTLNVFYCLPKYIHNNAYTNEAPVGLINLLTQDVLV